MKTFDIYNSSGNYVATVRFKSLAECEKFYPRHFGYKIVEDK